MDKCKHGFDHACLICGFTHIDGKKVWFDWAWQEQQKRIDELQKSANEMDEYITTAQRCLPYYLLDQESDENWIGGVQNEIVRLEQKNDELQARVDAALKETQHALRYVEEDMRGNHEFLQMAMIRTFKSLAQALEGGEE